MGWDETFMNMATLLSWRVSCIVVKTAAIYVDSEHRVLSLGYNGSVRGGYNCDEVGCAKIDGNPETGKLERCRGAHAEINGIINAANPKSLKGSTLYTVKYPCFDCMKALANAGVKEIVYFEKYLRTQTGGEKFEEETESEDLARMKKIKVRKFEGKIICPPAESRDSKENKKRENDCC
ncbi:MAG: dCMP deaminase family protein [Patescibacteria group bacterium]|nr:dCMP deaminase family protein [Patescibacteria group bacterium]